MRDNIATYINSNAAITVHDPFHEDTTCRAKLQIKSVPNHLLDNNICCYGSATFTYAELVFFLKPFVVDRWPFAFKFGRSTKKPHNVVHRANAAITLRFVDELGQLDSKLIRFASADTGVGVGLFSGGDERRRGHVEYLEGGVDRCQGEIRVKDVDVEERDDMVKVTRTEAISNSAGTVLRPERPAMAAASLPLSTPMSHCMICISVEEPALTLLLSYYLAVLQ